MLRRPGNRAGRRGRRRPVRRPGRLRDHPGLDQALLLLRGHHAYIDGARQLAEKIDPEQVESIELGIQSGGDVVVGNRNANAFHPRSIENLQYSLPFQFSLALLGLGNGYTTHRGYLEGRLDLGEGSDPARLAGRLRITPRPDLDTAYRGRWIADIAVTLRDGTRESLFVDNPLGTAENPMSQADLDAKFRDLTVDALGEERGAELLAAITGGPLDLPATALARLLVR